MSDIFGRKPCFFTCTTAFLLGCLGCAVAQDIILLNAMRALTGIGGGGLMTMGMMYADVLCEF
jgi:MFS family permease